MSPSRSVEAPLSSGKSVSGQSMPASLSISFSGSGFLATYQLGVAQSMLDWSPWVLQAAPKVMGASAGSLVAAAIVCGSSLDMVRDEMLRFARQMRSRVLGPLHPAGNVSVWIERMLRRLLPVDAHIRASGRLAIGMTRIPDGQNTMVSKFTSREDVVQALLCGCFLPGYCGIQPPRYKGVHYVDGGFSNIQPTNVCPIGHTLTVSPFAGEMDICPKDPAPLCDIVVSGVALHCSLVNGYRMIDALYPYNCEALDKAYHSGYRDGLHFLQTSDLVPCLPHLSIPSEPHFSPSPDGWTDLEEEQIERWEQKEDETEEVEEDDEEEDEEDVEEEWLDEVNVWSSLIETLGSQRNCSLEGGDLPWNLATLEQYLALPTWINTELLCNIMGLLWTHPLLRVMSHLLFLFTLPLSFLIEKTHRMGVLGFWMWQDLRQIALYIIGILVCSLRRNLQDRLQHNLTPLGSGARGCREGEEEVEGEEEEEEERWRERRSGDGPQHTSLSWAERGEDEERDLLAPHPNKTDLCGTP